MEKNLLSLFHIIAPFILVSILSLSSEVCLGRVLSVGKISPGFQGSYMRYIDNGGKFLESNSGEFSFGFISTTNDTSLFLLGIVHRATATVVWTANKGSLVSDSDNFVFDENGNAFLQKGRSMVWSTDTSDKEVSSMELLDTGNLVLLGNNGSVVWQSYSYPTDTLFPNQVFTEGMKLISELSPHNLTYVLEIKSGDVILSADFLAPQTYWSLQKDNRKTIDKDGGLVASASLTENSWRFYDKNKSLLSQFIFAGDSGANTTWVAVLGNKGFLTFFGLQSEGARSVSPIRIPQNSCSTPQPCGPYYICTGDNNCRCPSVLSSRSDCKPRNIVSSCNDSKSSVELVKADHGIHYFALDFLPPSSRTDLNGCKDSCLGNCSCLAMFFHNNSGNCFLLDNIGSFETSDANSGFVSYIKVSTSGSRGSNERSKNRTIVAVIFALSTLPVILVVSYLGFRYCRRKPKLDDPSGEYSEDDVVLLRNLTGLPTRFSYKDLEIATNNFSVKLGQGGFGSVYKGILPDGTHVAVKKLEATGQGKKEFRAEVSIIGSIHHHHLVRLKGFCAEGSHKLLAYEYMANGSLDQWIFKKSDGEFMLGWDTRFNIALGTAKGLAYLHEDCDSKIVHCDIKPENVLLDDNFLAKVSDFGLAKLMNREQSRVFTTLRGTRGYLAPEWITNTAISEKSDVYSYGMVLLEIIGGRKNYDPNETSENFHFPSFAFKMMEEGKLRDIVDSKLEIDENDERLHNAIKVSFWCMQEDMSRRPSMAKVVQMLEGLCVVPELPTCYPLGFRLYSSLFHPTREGVEPSNFNKGSYISAVHLSGPR
ncbi:G-type lectin S-receptor-like serine/threonine-protein kinase SD2-5 [Prosopis cineraria]|uniref:G-type lectin S-receptor-like serine/threonine-protein kinase SD2-5 n=1 Tax=Prosopis cineraria TaxID=364024 RepID=UPI002410728C|nr:G-type lectin S-receptor-like serine/threonine-protein kinase SD2-5 [Prosopis cineraria]